MKSIGIDCGTQAIKAVYLENGNIIHPVCCEHHGNCVDKVKRYSPAQVIY